MCRRVLKTNPGLINLTVASKQAASVERAVRAVRQHVGNTGADRQISALQLCGTEPATVVIQHLEVPQHRSHLLQACEEQDKMKNATEK